MDTLVFSLLAWVMAAMGVSGASIDPPMVIEMSAQDLTLEAYRDQPELLPASGIDQRVFALYSWEAGSNGAIYILNAASSEGLQDGEDPLENPIFQERLIHELVHHVQYHTDMYKQFQCRNQGEKQAYILGGKFLQQRSAFDPLFNRQVLAHIYSRC